MGYTKDQEFEADRGGTELEVDAGYSPYGAVSLFEELEQLHKEYVIHAGTPQQELAEVSVQALMGYFRSHPLASERLDAVNRLIEQRRWQDRKAQKPFHVEYFASDTAEPK